MTLLERDRVVADEWTMLDDDAPLAAGVQTIITLARLRREHAAIAERNAPLGVVLPTKAAGDDLSDVAAAATLIAVEFPSFRDGRGMTIARRLRERHGFVGTLRAIGHVLPDQHLFLLRCGFDQVEISRDEDMPAWIEAVGAFSMAYQPAVLHEAAVASQTTPGQTTHGLRRLRPGAAA